MDLYIGGTEHAVGHLLYSRMWTKVLFDLGLIGFDEPFKRLLNQGMIQGSSRLVYRLTPVLSRSRYHMVLADESEIYPVFISKASRNKFFHYELDASKKYFEISDKYNKNQQYKKFTKDEIAFTVDEIHVDVNFVDGLVLDIQKFKNWKEEFSEALIEFDENGKYLCGEEIEKMSKRYFNTVNPTDLCEKYGADTFRMYEMFLGPVEMSKPWDTKGIEGVHRFLKKFWRLFYDEAKGPVVNNDEPTAAELKVLHNTIKKIESDTERFSFNTAVSAFMIATNELTELKCHKRKILEPLLILLAPYAPHIAEELYAQLRQSPLSTCGEGAGGEASPLPTPWKGVGGEVFPAFEEKYVKETSKAYPVAINGKTRTELTLALDATQQQVEELVLQDATVQKWLDGKSPKKIIYVKNKMINVVI